MCGLPNHCDHSNHDDALVDLSEALFSSRNDKMRGAKNRTDQAAGASDLAGISGQALARGAVAEDYD
jgi:hypothetical protein